MADKIIYLFLVVLTGWAVTFVLRAVPFVLFAGKNRRSPVWLDRLGAVMSPVIIACLIIYSYSTLKIGNVPACKTLWPYIAGAVTVALQLIFRCSLASILAGTAVYMLLIGSCGCRSHGEIALDSRNPVVKISELGVSFSGKIVPPEKVPRILRSCAVPTDATIHIQMKSDLRDLRQARKLMSLLCKAGYRRPVLVSERRASSRIKSETQEPPKILNPVSRH